MVQVRQDRLAVADQLAIATTAGMEVITITRMLIIADAFCQSFSESPRAPQLPSFCTRVSEAACPSITVTQPGAPASPAPK